MAVRFDAAADRLLRTADLLDYNAAYTICSWVYILDATTLQVVFNENQNGASAADADLVRIISGQWILTATIGGTGADVGGGSVAVNAWYHVTLVRNSVSDIRLIIDGTEVAQQTQDITGRGAATRMEWGAATTGNENPLSGRVAVQKAWSTNLAAAEVLNERHTIIPKRTANLYGWWPIFPGATERLEDDSGNGRNWTAGGTLTDEPPPPVSYGGSSIFLPFTASAVVGPLIDGRLVKHGILQGRLV